MDIWFSPSEIQTQRPSNKTQTEASNRKNRWNQNETLNSILLRQPVFRKWFVKCLVSLHLQVHILKSRFPKEVMNEIAHIQMLHIF
jgi:hypothetical protein